MEGMYWDSFDCQVQCEEIYEADAILDEALLEELNRE
jgi:hypothetical protein